MKPVHTMISLFNIGGKTLHDWYYEVIEDATPGFNSGSTTTKTGTIEAEEEIEVDFVQ